jgi:hypothetical protein
MSTIFAIPSGWGPALFLPRAFVNGFFYRNGTRDAATRATLCQVDLSDAKRIIYDVRGSSELRADWLRAQEGMGKGDRSAAHLGADLFSRHPPPCDATDGRRREHMTRLRKIVGLTLAVVLATALVAYLLRPSASPTTTSIVTQPPTDQTCPTRYHGHNALSCGSTTGTTNSGGGHGSNGDNETDDHDNHGGHSDGDHDWNDHDGDGHGHSGHGDHDGEGRHGEGSGDSDRERGHGNGNHEP